MLFVALLVAFIAAAYGGSVRNGFVWDDQTYNCDHDVIKTVTHRVKLAESK